MKDTSVSVQSIVSFLKDEVVGVHGIVNDRCVDNVAEPDNTNETTLDWIGSNRKNKQSIAEASVAKVIMADSEVRYSETMAKVGKTLIIVNRPRMAMAKVMTQFFLSKKSPTIHPSAVVDKDAVIAPSAYIGPGCVIGKAQIGANTILQGNVFVYDDTIIGDNCLLQAGAVIGTDGLGCSREKDGSLIKFPHLGGIVIGNNVEIGANCQIAKGGLSNTIIEDGCKINGLCFIAHNCHLKRNVWISGNTILCGSVTVGENTTIFSSVTVRDQRHIGANCVIGMGSLVTKDVPDNELWMGVPAKKVEK